MLTTATFYLLPATWQAQRLWQFSPQIIAYACFGLWALRHTDLAGRLGLESTKLKAGLWKGLGVGLLLGNLNTALILYGAPQLGIDIRFLLETPHAHMPVALMVPWIILLIALGVEINFRGFVLGRLLAIFSTTRLPLIKIQGVAYLLALGISSILFTYDPFMVSTFRELHWIALWDGLIWGGLWLHTRNLYIPIAAHAMEVIIEFLTIRAVLA
jgi:membrane protease YdiL (CAAX protease family)